MDSDPNHSLEDTSAGRERRLAVRIRIKIPWEAITFSLCRASGAGGQHVNTTDSAVQLRLDLAAAALAPALLARLRRLARHKISLDGILQITAQTHRQQHRNKEEAVEKLIALLNQAAHPPTPRRPTHVPSASRKKRLDTKNRQAERKQERRKPERSGE